MKDDEFQIEIVDPAFVEQEKCIYAFMRNGEFLRFGSSKGPLKRRLKRWKNDVSNSFKQVQSNTPSEEAERWRKLDSGELWAKQGSKVLTRVGEFCAYLDEESLLIGRHLPPMNRSKHR